jgi:ectoine hydroxylase-related dioxygenase (phytanoyl-CoA dioxygenase family)
VGFDIRSADIDELAVGTRGAHDDELAALDEQGYVVVPGLLSDDVLDRLRHEFERLIWADPQGRTSELGTRRSRALRDNELMAVCWRHRVVLDAAAHVLGDLFQVGVVDLRDPLPGHGIQAFHPDTGPTPVPGITATWFLDDFTDENGATRILPGTHRSVRPPAGARSADVVAGEVAATGAAGSVLLRDARLYHAAGRNRTEAHRRGAFVFYQHHLPEPS